MNLINQNLKKFREQKEFSYSKLSEMTGIAKSTLQRYETGSTTKIPLDAVKKIADALRVSQSALMGWDEKKESDIYPYNPMHKIPILGTISAGRPLYAEECIEGYTTTDRNGHAEYFALRVKGDSMNAARICDNDILIVKRQPMVESGEIAVVMVEKENATVKKVYFSDHTITLMPQSTNSAHQPQIYNLATTKIEIIGKVVENKIML